MKLTLEEALAALHAKQLEGEALTEQEERVLSALARVNAAEAAARDVFAGFYTNLGVGSTDTALPPEVGLYLSSWVEARKLWEEASEAYQATLNRAPVRRGPRLGLRPPERIKLPAALPAKDALAVLFSPQFWTQEPSGEALTAQLNKTAQVRLELDTVLGFGPDQAIQQVARYGPSAAQTFLGLAALWEEQCAGQSQETYMTVYASDLLRFQGKKETPKGGYHREDLLAKGRDLYLLSRITLPHATGSQSFTLGRLLSLEALEVIDEPGMGQSIVRFRFHLGREAHAWMQESAAQVAPRLLAYHPVRQKYQILLGFCLAWYDQQHPGEENRIPLPRLLELAAIPMPEKRLSEFLTSLEDALSDLARDNVVPGLRLIKPAHWPELLAARRTREILQQSEVIFPHLPLALPAKPTG